MQLLSQTKLNEDIAIIKLFHSRLGNDLCKSMAYGTGNFMHIDLLNNKNILISIYLDILLRYTIRGDATIAAAENVLTLTEIEAIIDDCYRELNKYNY